MKIQFLLLAVVLSLCKRTSAQSQSYTICPGSPVTLTAGNFPGITNITYSINPGGFSSPSPTFVVSPNSNTTYTLYTSGNNGSSNVTYSVTATVYVGSTAYNLAASHNFTLGCLTKSVETVTVTNILTNPPGGITTCSLLVPGSGPVAPGGPLLNQTVFSLTAPGTYTMVVRDGLECDARVTFQVIQDIFPPVLDSITGENVLSCYTPSTVLQGTSTNPHVVYTWLTPSATVNGNSLTLFANFNAPATIFLGNYTISLLDQNNLCTSSHIVQVKQNLFPPKAKIGVGGTLTCLTPKVLLTNQSSSGIPPQSGFPTNGPVVASLWIGPGIGIIPVSSTYTAYISGVYTLQVTDLNNGCTSSTVAYVGENKVFPIVNEPLIPANICGSNTTATLVPLIMSNTVNLSYVWTAPPNAIITGGLNSKNIVTQTPGTYSLEVKDNGSGCVTFAELHVVQCVGVNEFFDERINVFPNPASDVINFSSDEKAEFELTVFDVSGKKVMSRTVNSGDQINIQHFENGIYIVRITRGGNLCGTLKVLKM